MPDWEERIRAGSHPVLRVEHEVRYAAAAPIALESDLWCDLGCGTATGSAGPLQAFGGRAVLVDIDAGSIAEACARFPAAATEGVVADLATTEGIAAAYASLGSGDRGCITCFEVIEHLHSFAPAITMLVDLAEKRGFTVVMSVPNDGFWDMRNPFHKSRWSEGAFEELTSMLPRDHVVAFQTALAGSCVVRGDRRVEAESDVSTRNVPTHFVTAFGPRADDLGSPVGLTASDLAGQRVWERQREADLAYFKSLAERSS